MIAGGSQFDRSGNCRSPSIVSRPRQDALAAALATVDQEQAIRYAEIVLAVLPAAARRHWEALMTAQTFEFQSEYARRLRAEGEAKREPRGIARAKLEERHEALLAVLEARGIGIRDEVRTRITSCSDLQQLDGWVRRAAIVRTIDELFE